MIAPTLCFKIMVLAVCKDRNVVLETKPQKGKSVMITSVAEKRASKFYSETRSELSAGCERESKICQWDGE